MSHKDITTFHMWVYRTVNVLNLSDCFTRKTNKQTKRLELLYHSFQNNWLISLSVIFQICLQGMLENSVCSLQIYFFLFLWYIQNALFQIAQAASFELREHWKEVACISRENKYWCYNLGQWFTLFKFDYPNCLLISTSNILIAEL